MHKIGGCRRVRGGNWGLSKNGRRESGLSKASRNRVKSCATFSGIPRVSFGWSRWERCDALPLWWQFQTFVPHGSSIARRVRAAGKAIGLDWSNCSSWRSMLQAADGSGNPAARVPFARLGPHLDFSLNGTGNQVARPTGLLGGFPLHFRTWGSVFEIALQRRRALSPCP